MFNGAEAMAHVIALATDIGTRPSATPAEVAAAEYIKVQLASFGYEVTYQEFLIEGASDNTAVMSLADGTEIPALPMNGSLGGHVAGPLSDAGVGHPEEFTLDAVGGVALVRRGTLPFADIVQNAADAGAVAVIISNKEPGPFRGDLPNGGVVPTVSVAQESGEDLIQLMATGPQTISVSVRLEEVNGAGHNVISKATDGDCTLIIGGHYDSVPDGPGANDNASGTAVAIELARTLAADGLDPGLCVILFSGEERGLLGSSYYVSSLTEAQRQAIAAFLNFDMLGVGEGWPIIGTQDLMDLATEEAAAIGITTEQSELPPNVGSDHAPFIDAGIPAVLFNCFCDEHYHTVLDRAEFVEVERLQQAGDFGLAMALGLLAS